MTSALMKRAVGFLWVVAMAAAPADAQPFTLENLKTPSSPAFVILGVEPTSVERPTTPRAFALSLLSPATEPGAGLLPEDYAAEVAPYWMAPQRQLTWDEYFNPSPLQSILQTFSVSLATHTFSETDTTTGIGIGVRLTPFPGHSSSTADSLAGALAVSQRARLPLLRARRRATSPDQIAEIDSALSVNAAASQGIAQQLQANDERVGLRLQLAGATAAFYPGNDFQAGKIGSVGVWSTLGYRLERPGMDLLALGRYLRTEEGATQDVWDVGGRAVLLANRFSASMEWVARSASDAGGTGPAGEPALDSGNRVVGMFEYRATGDLFVSFSFGQDYPREGEVGQPLVAILGGQFNFGSKPLISLPPSN
jgi:hypothetical protein